MALFRPDASIRSEGSHGALADLVGQEWGELVPNDVVVRRQIGLDPIPSTTCGLAVAAQVALHSADA